MPGLQGCEGDRVAAAVAGAGYIGRDGGEKIYRVECAACVAAVIGSAAGCAVFDPLGIMLADGFMDGGGCWVGGGYS